MLFPGTSTVQTRARYFLFVPWIYLQVEEHRLSPAAQQARTREIELITHLKRSPNHDGLIGVRAQENLERLPSNIYWQGLGTWGIRRFPGSQTRYHRYLDAIARAPKAPRKSGEEAAEAEGPFRSWDPHLPAVSGGFPKGTTFALRRAEAEYLRDRILAAVPGTMLAFLVDRGKPTHDVGFPWEHPQHAELPTAIQDLLHHADCFSESVHGAALLYNLMLAEKADWSDGIQTYGKRLQEWSATIDEHLQALTAWHDQLPEFWQVSLSGGARVPIAARRFVEQWLSLALPSGAAAGVPKNERARQLVHDRERGLKGRLARLENPRALELWSGQAGAAQLDFRWPVAQRIVNDIQHGLKGDGDDATAE